jgi:PPK2 family polyphosphate:nucleotide phosphotransferase
MADKLSSFLKATGRFVDPFRISQGNKFRLRDIDPADTRGLKSGEHAHDLLAAGVEMLSEMQGLLYAEDRWAVLSIFQAMDAAGKDSAIKHVMSGVNPQGCSVHSFKHPSDDELQHDFLWRAVQQLPGRGRIGIFNRSYYEEVLVVRVHPDLLKREQLPPRRVAGDVWDERFTAINNLERHLVGSGTVFCKFFLHLSPEEQKRRFLKRLEEPEKHWKFSLADIRERRYWNDYMKAYEDMVRHTATPHAPWYVVPADHKWFTQVVVAAVIVHTLRDLKLHYPTLGAEQRRSLKRARRELATEK